MRTEWGRGVRGGVERRRTLEAWVGAGRGSGRVQQARKGAEPCSCQPELQEGPWAPEPRIEGRLPRPGAAEPIGWPPRDLGGAVGALGPCGENAGARPQGPGALPA